MWMHIHESRGAYCSTAVRLCFNICILFGLLLLFVLNMFCNHSRLDFQTTDALSNVKIGFFCLKLELKYNQANLVPGVHCIGWIWMQGAVIGALDTLLGYGQIRTKTSKQCLFAHCLFWVSSLFYIIISYIYINTKRIETVEGNTRNTHTKNESLGGYLEC